MSDVRYAVEHLGLAARNALQLKEWYVAVLGARVLYDNRLLPPAFVLEIGPGRWIEIYPSSGPNHAPLENQDPGWRHIALRVDSIEQARADLAAKGVSFTEPIKPAGGGGRVLFFQDPEGNLLHLVERTAESALNFPTAKSAAS